MGDRRSRFPLAVPVGPSLATGRRPARHRSSRPYWSTRCDSLSADPQRLVRVGRRHLEVVGDLIVLIEPAKISHLYLQEATERPSQVDPEILAPLNRPLQPSVSHRLRCGELRHLVKLCLLVQRLVEVTDDVPMFYWTEEAHNCGPPCVPLDAVRGPHTVYTRGSLYPDH